MKECEVKWALESITSKKASGGDGIPVKLFQILKDAAVKVLHSICQQILKTQHWPQDWKRSVFIPIPKKDNAKECSNCRTIALISHASKLMLKILQARLQQYMNLELPDVQDDFRKGRGTRDQIANIRWIMEKASEFQKNIYFCFIDYAKAFECVDQNKLENFERVGNTRPPDLPLEKSVCRSRRLLLGRKTMTNLDSILESRDITLLTKVCIIKAMVFPVVVYDVRIGP